MSGALDGIRILDLTWGIAGPVAGWLLAEQGADVVKVEPPGGDPYRAHPGSAVWHRSRRSIELDLRTDAGVDDLLGLVDGADVLVEAHAPGTMAEFGLAPDVLVERNPRLVVCSIPAYPRGHRAAARHGYDALVQARSGQQWEQPGWRPGPVHLHFPAPSMGACFLAASGVLAALVDRERTGRGQIVETSLLDGALVYTTQIWQEHERPGPGFRSIMHKSYPPGIHQGSVHECAGGEWIHAATMSGRTPTRTLEEVLGLEAVDLMSLYSDPQARAEHEARLRTAFLGRDRATLIDELHAAGLGAEAIVPMDEAFDHPQLRANGMVAHVDDPEFGATTQIGVPIHLRDTPGSIRGPRPLPGADTESVLAASGTAPSSASTATAEPDRRGPLAGVRVLDIGQFLAGPFGPMILADLGADVIKVEPLRGDSMRMAAMPFIGCQRNKRGLAVDLKTDEGLEVVLRLAEQADVVHHNMTKGTAERLGIGYEALRERNPALVHCNTYAYGPEGPMSDFGGLDPLYQAATGLEYEAGAVHTGNRPSYLRFGMTDTANALLSVVAVLAALVHQRRTGSGQDLWTSLLDGAAVFSSDVFLRSDGDAPRRPRLDAGQHGTSPCHRLYETQDGWVQVAAFGDGDWAGLCRNLGLDDLADDARLATHEGRVALRSEVEPLLEEAFRTRTAVSWVHQFDAAGVPAEVAVDTVDGSLALHDGDLERLGSVVDTDHPHIGRIRQFARFVRFSAHDGAPQLPPPMVGEHTREVLAEHGFSIEEVDRLFAAGVVSEPTDDYAWPV